MPPTRSVLRSLPSVDRLLRRPQVAALRECYASALVVSQVRVLVGELRAQVRAGSLAAVPPDTVLVERLRCRLAAVAGPSLRPLVNATGVVLHTNLGRAPLADAATAAVAGAARGAVNIEYDLEQGDRGDRDVHVAGHLLALTGAEAVTVVNNNAAAVLLALNTLAQGRDVVVSRGELIEIGGSFRLPEIIEKSGARLCPVGTTNRTRLSDYSDAVGPRTAALLKVHPSNYRVVGFAASVPLEELVSLARRTGLPVVEDLGSGALVDMVARGLPREPLVADSIAAGADLVTFSGDKLLGGPQAGVLAGGRSVIERVCRNPLKRALRCDKLTIAALEATLRVYRTAPDPWEVLPVLRTLARPLAEIEKLAQAALALLRERLGSQVDVEIVEVETAVGSGALPVATIPSLALALRHRARGPLWLAHFFRRNEPPIIGRVHADCFLLDMRCVTEATDVVPGAVLSVPSDTP